MALLAALSAKRRRTPTTATAQAWRTLWAIAKSPELHLSDEDLHVVVFRETGKESMKKLSQGEINEVARVLQNMKDSVNRAAHTKRTDTGGDARTVQQRRKIFALTEELGWNSDPREALREPLDAPGDRKSVV